MYRIRWVQKLFFFSCHLFSFRMLSIFWILERFSVNADKICSYKRFFRKKFILSLLNWIISLNLIILNFSLTKILANFLWDVTASDLFDKFSHTYFIICIMWMIENFLRNKSINISSFSRKFFCERVIN